MIFSGLYRIPACLSAIRNTKVVNASHKTIAVRDNRMILLLNQISSDH